MDPRPTSPQVPRASSRVRPSKTDRDQLRGDHVVFVQATPLMRPTSSSPQLQLSTPTRSRPTTTNLGQQCGTRRARPRCLAAPRVALLLPEGAVSSSADNGRSLTLGAIDQISGSLDPKFSLVRVVETRGIEPLTPALQTFGYHTERQESAVQRDPSRVRAASAVHGRTERTAIMAAILSIVDDRPERGRVH